MRSRSELASRPDFVPRQSKQVEANLAVDMSISGHVSAGFEPLRAAFEANFADGHELGAAVSVILDGETVVDIQGGEKGRNSGEAWDSRTLVPIFSTTKPISAIVVALVLDRAADRLPLGYETRLAEIWPEFGAAGKEAYTIGEVLSHQAGLSGFPFAMDPGDWFDQRKIAAHLAGMEPLWPRGQGSGYHPITWGYLAQEIVMRIDGRSLGTVLREDIAGQADAELDFWIGLPEAEHARVAGMQRPREYPELGELNDATKAAFLKKWSAPDRGDAVWKTMEIPSANGIGTALAVARLYQLFANGFEWAGRPLFDGETTASALTRSRVSGPDRVLPFDLDFAAGVMRNTRGVYGPEPETLAHSGWGGSMALGDPVRRLSMAYVMNRQSNSLQGDPRARRLVEALYACV